MKLILLLFFALSLNAKSINIAVAANLSYCMNALKKEFKKEHPEIDIKLTIGGSGKLATQIIHGAPYGLFLSADMYYPEMLYKKRVATSKPLVYAKGALAVLSKKPRNFANGISILEEKKIRKIAIANPKTAPYGRASVEALKNAKIYSKIKNKFVYSESISQTLSYIITATDIGIIAKSALFSYKLTQFKQNIHWSEIDSSLYTPIKQGIVLLKYAKNKKEYKLFYEFILSEKAKTIFKKYGYS